MNKKSGWVSKRTKGKRLPSLWGWTDSPKEASLPLAKLHEYGLGRPTHSAGRTGLTAHSAGVGPAHQQSQGGCWGDAGATVQVLTALAEGLQVHRLVGCRAVHHSLQDAFYQSQLVAWENPEVLSRQVAQPVAVLTGELYQEGGAAGKGKEKPLVTPSGFPPEVLMARPASLGNVPFFHFPAQFHEHGSPTAPEAGVLRRAWGFSVGRGWAAPSPHDSPEPHRLDHTLHLKNASPWEIALGKKILLVPSTNLVLIGTKPSFPNEWGGGGRTAQTTYRESRILVSPGREMSFPAKSFPESS